MAKKAIKMEPQTNDVVFWEKYVIGITKVVRARRMSEYMRELRSNTSPKEKAPRMFEIAEPTILPMARDARLCASDATTTAS
jgi:hypothetical protein